MYLRQSILLSAYETPDTRSVYNGLKNVAGKVRTEKRYNPINVPAGIDQVKKSYFPPRHGSCVFFLLNKNFVHFDCDSPVDEPEKRFHHFTTQLLPSIFKSAVQSTNTIIFIPSSFDFIRIQNYFRKKGGLTFTVLSE